MKIDAQLPRPNADGATIAGGLIPGTSVISAAVSSVSHRASACTASTAAPAGSGGALAGMNADLASSQAENQRLYQQQLQGPAAGGSTVGSMNAELLRAQLDNQRRYELQRMGGAGGDSVAGMNLDLIQSQADNAALLKVQIALQHENEVYSSVSNVEKTRHDTVKNSIGNIR